MIKLDKAVWQNILDYDLIKLGDNIVIGLSGGPDSMALLYSLLYAKKHFLDFNIIVAHVNHGVRGEEALTDQLFVEKVAKDLNLLHYSINVDMVQHGKEMGITAEEAGRELRYGFFRDILKTHGGGKIAVAHNKNDQAETLLMRIMRGTGIDGLKGMDFKIGDIIRPILNIHRSEIENYLSTNKIKTRLDKTNLMPIYTRNKVRLEMIPYIESNFNPNLIDSLWRLSQIANLDSQFLEKYSREKFENIAKIKNKDKIILDINLFEAEDEAIQKRIIRIAIEKILSGLQGFSEHHVNSVLDLRNLGTGKELNLPQDLIARTSYGNLIIEKIQDKKFQDFNYNLDLGHNQFTNIDYTFDVQILEINRIKEIKMGRYVKCFDYDKLKGQLAIRNRLRGDKFVPFGMRGTKKLKDYFIDEKINKEIRKEIPLLIDGENILWVVGYRTSDLYKITEKTKNVLVVRVEH